MLAAVLQHYFAELEKGFVSCLTELQPDFQPVVQTQYCYHVRVTQQFLQMHYGKKLDAKADGRLLMP